MIRSTLVLFVSVLILWAVACSDDAQPESDAQSNTDAPTKVEPEPATIPALFTIPTAEELNQALGEPEYWSEVQVLGEGDPLQERFGTLRVQCDGPEFQPVTFEAAMYSGFSGGGVGDSAFYRIYGFSDADAAAAAFAAGSVAGECEGDGADEWRGPEPFTVADGQAIRFTATYELGPFLISSGEEVWVLREDTILVVAIQGAFEDIGPYVTEAT